jgi:putative ABC transport system ATP-binding protein
VSAVGPAAEPTAPSPGGAVLLMEGVGKRYPGNPPVDSLRGVNLRIEAGELVAVVGPSGSGKTTLLHVMGTLERPTEGAVWLDGEWTGGLSDRALSGLRAWKLGFVFQHFHLLEGLSARDNVAHGLLYRGVPAAERRRLATSALERVGMSHRLHHVPAQLSGGERQRVAIARALAGRPAVVLADEPTGNLDSVSSRQTVDLLLDLNRDGATIVVVTHNQELAQALPRRVELRDGQVVADLRSTT